MVLKASLDKVNRLKLPVNLQPCLRDEGINNRKNQKTKNKESRKKKVSEQSS